MDGAFRARGRGAGDRGADRRARGRARLDGGARLVDGGHGVRRRRIQVGGGAARGARRDRPPGRRAAAAAAGGRPHPGRPRGVGDGLGAAIRAACRRRGSSRCRWARRNIAGRARRSARCASSRTRCCAPRWSGSPGSPRWRRWGARAKRWSSRPPTPSCGPRAPRFRTSRPRCGRGSTACPGRPRRTISSTTRCSAS